MTTRRRGSTLLELLVALPIFAIIGAMGALLLLETHRLARNSDSAITSTRELRHATAVLAGDLRPLAAIDIRAWSDTAIEFDATVGIGIVCDARAPRNELHLLPTSNADAGRSSWNVTPQSGDAVIAWRSATGISAEPIAMRSTLSSISATRNCSASPQLLGSATPSALTQRLTLRDTLPQSVMLGTPVRVARRTRLALYHATDGAWYLGRTSWSGTGWDVIQPVAGPLQSPRNHGLHIEMRDSMGTTVSPATSPAAQLHIELRAPRRTPNVTRASAAVLVDSAIVDITMRADRSGEIPQC